MREIRESVRQLLGRFTWRGKPLTTTYEVIWLHGEKEIESSCGPKGRDGSTPFSGTNKTREPVVPGIKRWRRLRCPASDSGANLGRC